jgi:uncharacterized protein YqgV (UPF0045/DUF77 family)
MHISTQMSLYPLRQPRLSPAIETVWKVLEKDQLDCKKGHVSTVISGEAEVVFGAIKEGFLRSAGNGLVSMVVTFSNACPI